MPAVRYRIYLCPEIDGQPARVLPFPEWWDAAAIFRAYENRRIDIPSLAYDDSALLLTYGEAAQIDESARRAFREDPRADQPYFIEAMANLETALRTTRWVIVEAYEWESGLD